jgi:hypothetical protein
MLQDVGLWHNEHNQRFWHLRHQVLYATFHLISLVKAALLHHLHALQVDDTKARGITCHCKPL